MLIGISMNCKYGGNCKATSYKEGNYSLIERLAVIEEGDENSESTTSAVVKTLAKTFVLC